MGRTQPTTSTQHAPPTTNAPTRTPTAACSKERYTCASMSAFIGQPESLMERWDHAFVQLHTAIHQANLELWGPPQAVAAAGIQGGGGPLPYLDHIQASFGRHDIGGVRAFTGGGAARAAGALGASGYAIGDAVAFARTPDLFLAAHEATHVVQQRAGVSLSGGLGREGDTYERHADEVAGLVVRGQSAESVLDRMAPAGARGRSSAVQRKRDVPDPSKGKNVGKSEKFPERGPLTKELGLDADSDEKEIRRIALQASLASEKRDKPSAALIEGLAKRGAFVSNRLSGMAQSTHTTLVRGAEQRGRVAEIVTGQMRGLVDRCSASIIEFMTIGNAFTNLALAAWAGKDIANGASTLAKLAGKLLGTFLTWKALERSIDEQTKEKVDLADTWETRADIGWEIARETLKTLVQFNLNRVAGGSQWDEVLADSTGVIVDFIKDVIEEALRQAPVTLTETGELRGDQLEKHMAGTQPPKRPKRGGKRGGKRRSAPKSFKRFGGDFWVAAFKKHFPPLLASLVSKLINKDVDRGLDKAFERYGVRGKKRKIVIEVVVQKAIQLAIEEVFSLSAAVGVALGKADDSRGAKVRAVIKTVCEWASGLSKYLTEKEMSRIVLDVVRSIASGGSHGNLQRKGAPGGAERRTSEAMRGIAAGGLAGGGGQLPHLGRIQTSFGRHDVSGVRAHVGGPAAAASQSIGAEAYASGDEVAFARAPSLFLAAHEAAHVVQQRAGVSLSGGVGRTGDRYEQHADAVAAAVVAGRDAEPVLDRLAGPGDRGSAGSRRPQRKSDASSELKPSPSEEAPWQTDKQPNPESDRDKQGDPKDDKDSVPKKDK